MLRIVLAALFSGIVGASAGIVATSALAAGPDKGPSADSADLPIQILTHAMHEATGAPARAAIGDQATVRLATGTILIPREAAAKLLMVADMRVPPDFSALLVGPEGMEALGIVRYVPAGFVDSDAALAWTPDDILASLNDTVAHGNPDRVKQKQPAQEARSWVLPPHYNPETHQITWAPLIVPKTAPRETDGEVAYQAIGFGREGYIQLTVVSSLQKAPIIRHMADDFLSGLSFLPGKAYRDAQANDRRASTGLAGAMGIDAFHKAPIRRYSYGPDTVIPVAGAIVAAIGALSLLIYIRRYRRREARRG